jgi:hypothetical protein
MGKVSIVPILLIVLTLMLKAVSSSETLVLTKTTWRHIPEDGILHSHRHEISELIRASKYVQHFEVHLYLC